MVVRPPRTQMGMPGGRRKRQTTTANRQFALVPMRSDFGGLAQHFEEASVLRSAL